MLAAALTRYGAAQGLLGFALSVLAGAITALGQAPLDLWPLALLGLALGLLRMQAADEAKPAFGRGWGFGLGYFALALSWIVEPFLVDIARHGWMAPFALFFMAGGLALFWGAAAAVARRLGGTPLALIVTLAAAELVRSYLFTGFPWALIGHLWIPTPVAQWASLIGPHGLTLLALAVATGMAQSARHVTGGVVTLSATALLWLGGAYLAGEPQDLKGRPVVRLVQPNAPQHQKWDPAHIPVFFRRQIEATRATPRPELVIWPETSVPVSLDRSEETLQVMAQAAGGVPVVFGIQRWEGRQIYNSAVLMDGLGQVTNIYDKAHLVPFGEYVPFGDLLGGFGIHGMAARDGDGFSAGPGARLMPLGALGRALPLICYEAVFPNDVNASAERPDLLMQLTNDAWFGQISGPYQHLAQARLRAIEQGLPMVRAANTGVSAVIDGKGRVIAQLGLGQTGHLDHALPPALPRTLYAQTGDYLALVAIMGLFLAVITLRRFPKRRFAD